MSVANELDRRIDEIRRDPVLSRRLDELRRGLTERKPLAERLAQMRREQIEEIRRERVGLDMFGVAKRWPAR